MADIYKVVLRGHFDGGDQTRTVFYLGSSGAGVPGWTALDTWLNTMYTAGLMAKITNKFTYDAYDLYLYDALQLYWSYLGTNAYVKAGTDGGLVAPQQTALVVVARTNIKKVVPKKFIPGVCAGYINQGKLDAAVVTLLTSYGSCWMSSFVDGGDTFEPGTFTKSHTFTNLQGTRANTYVGSQRRRKQGLGI